jgi:hypothetical protein
MSATITREREMVEHEFAAFSRLFVKVQERLPDRELSEEEMLAVIVETYESDPEARELFGQLSVFQRFQGSA